MESFILSILEGASSHVLDEYEAERATYQHAVRAARFLRCLQAQRLS